jgi:predicted ABC-type ATPase
MNRATLGGHSASERKLRDIYEHSLKNLLTAFEENRNRRIDLLRIFDNSEYFARPRLVLSMIRGVPRNIAAEVPAWLETALAPSSFNIGNLRGAML